MKTFMEMNNMNGFFLSLEDGAKLMLEFGSDDLYYSLFTGLPKGQVHFFFLKQIQLLDFSLGFNENFKSLLYCRTCFNSPLNLLSRKSTCFSQANLKK